MSERTAYPTLPYINKGIEQPKKNYKIQHMSSANNGEPKATKATIRPAFFEYPFSLKMLIHFFMAQMRKPSIAKKMKKMSCIIPPKGENP